MAILETLLPLGILIALGAALARVGFLGRPFMADLNRLGALVKDEDLSRYIL